MSAAHLLRGPLALAGAPLAPLARCARAGALRRLGGALVLAGARLAPAARWRRLLATLALALAPVAALAQGVPVSLVADRLRIEGEARLVAEGAVEVLAEGLRLTARRIVYDRAADQLAIEGPITLTDGTGTVVFADAADLDGDLTEGILRSARLVFDRQLQIAAAEIARIGDRYTRADRVVASSCRICAQNPTPLWEIRAARIVHDREARQIWFDRAQFRVAGLPVAYVPRLRLPEPGVERATGFLTPRARVSSEAGVSIDLPYFIAVSDSRDVTLTPHLSSDGAVGLGLRYREAFSFGMLEIGGALVRDRLEPEQPRGYGYIRGAFVLPRDFRLSVDALAATDERYLSDYDISDDDRRRSQIALWRVDRAERLRLRALGFTTLRTGEDDATEPSQALALDWRRRFALPGTGATVAAEFAALALRRPSELVGDGRDLARVSALLEARRGWVLPGGIEATLIGQAAVDRQELRQDPAAGSHDRSLLQGGLELRWPWVRAATDGGARHAIEPVAQLIWTRASGGLAANEDSRMQELDEGNLFGLTRFPGHDARETGARVNLGITWTRIDPAGWESRLTFGRILREDAQAGLPGGFAAGGPLAGARSDWLAALELDLARGLSLTQRALFDSDLDLSRGELWLDWTRPELALSTGFTHLAALAEEGRAEDTTEWTLSAEWGIAPGWEASVGWRYDIDNRDLARADLGLVYRNECVLVDVSLSRRLATSTSVRSDTNFGLSIELLGFGGRPAGPARRCLD